MISCSTANSCCRSMQHKHRFKIASEEKPTVIAALREHLPDNPSWSTVKKLLRSRFVAIGGVLCVDEARKVGAGEVITVSDRPFPPVPTDKDVAIAHVDSELVIAEKPSGMVTLRRKPDLHWSWARKNRQPTLDECVPRLIGTHAANKKKSERIAVHLPRMFPVHRIDRDSSGLLVFARNKEAQTNIIHQFAQHDAVRKYLAIIPGKIKDQTVTSQFIRDRGDGLRGSTTDTTIGEQAVTHFRTLRILGPGGKFSEIECTLETGRTNQIRIHLAELQHPICGDIKYRCKFGQSPVADKSTARRLALHAAELKFVHPTTNKLMEFKTAWPTEMLKLIEKLEA